MYSVSFAHSAAAGGAGTSCHLALRFLLQFGWISVPFWLHFELRGVPVDPLEPLCLAPVPQDPQNAIFGLILGGPWEPIWHPVATNFGLWTRSGGIGGARWRHFGPIRSPLDFDVILDPQNDPKL